MNLAEMVYSLYVVFALALVVAGIVEGSRWAVTRWQMWSVRRWIKREIERAERAHEEEQRAWRASWGGDY